MKKKLSAIIYKIKNRLRIKHHNFKECSDQAFKTFNIFGTGLKAVAEILDIQNNPAKVKKWNNKKLRLENILTREQTRQVMAIGDFRVLKTLLSSNW